MPLPVNKLNAYSCDCFEGHYPVGVSAVIIAETAEQAATLLNESLARNHLPQEKPVKVEDITLLPMYVPTVYIINDGNY